MSIKDLINKALKGEALSDADKATLGEYDPDAALNAAAAASRRKAEEQAAASAKALEDERKAHQATKDQIADAANKGKTETERLRADLASAAGKITDLEGRFTRSETEKAALVRRQALQQVRTAAGIQFAPGLDHGMLEESFTRALEGVDLGDANVVKLKVGTWATMNKAAILDTTGHGSGAPPRSADEAAAARNRDIDSMTPAQRAADLRKKGLA
jgi:hypothetical protein